MGFDPQDFSILFTDNSEIHELNAQFRKKNKPTDVLSFEGEGDYLGDLVISIDKAKSQAKEFACSLQEEIVRLIIHGFLHLHGYDHVGVSKSDAQKMRRTEKRLMTLIKDTWPNYL